MILFRELALLNYHYNPAVAKFALETAKLGPSLPNEYPKAMLDRYDTTATGEFIPSVAIAKPNPLHNKLSVTIRNEIVLHY